MIIKIQQLALSERVPPSASARPSETGPGRFHEYQRNRCDPSRKSVTFFGQLQAGLVPAILDLKLHFRCCKFAIEAIKMLSEKPEVFLFWHFSINRPLWRYSPSFQPFANSTLGKGLNVEDISLRLCWFLWFVGFLCNSFEMQFTH